MERKIIERKIGERFDYNVTLEVVEQAEDTCDSCYFFSVHANTIAYAVVYFAAIVNRLFLRR